MDVSATTWWVTIGAMVVFLVIDVGIIARRPHVPSMRECAIALSFYVGAAVVFGIWIWSHSGSQYAGEFFAGWLTEYSLSIDNLFVFLLIMRKFLVPEKLQQEALVIGIVIAIILRGIFIALGAAVINEFASVFYIFGAVPHLHGGQAGPRGRRPRTTSSRRTGSSSGSNDGSR